MVDPNDPFSNNPFKDTAASEAMEFIAMTNMVIIAIAFLLVQILRRRLPQIWYAQDIVNNEWSVKRRRGRRGFRNQPLSRRRQWIREVFSRVWFLEGIWADPEVYSRRVGSTVYPLFRWQRFVVLQLTVFLAGSCIILIPINLLADPNPDAPKDATLFLRVSSASVRQGSPWYWAHLGLFTVYSLYFVACYSRFTRRHVALVQNLKLRRPALATQTVLVRNIPPGLRVRCRLEEALASSVEPGSIARVCPAPLDAPALSRSHNRLARAEADLRASLLLAHEPHPKERLEAEIAGTGLAAAVAADAAAASPDGSDATFAPGDTVDGASHTRASNLSVWHGSEPRLVTSDGSVLVLNRASGLWTSSPEPRAQGSAVGAAADAISEQSPLLGRPNLFTSPSMGLSYRDAYNVADSTTTMTCLSDDWQSAFSDDYSACIGEGNESFGALLPETGSHGPSTVPVPDFVAAAAAMADASSPAAFAEQRSSLGYNTKDMIGKSNLLYKKAQRKRLERAARRGSKQPRRAKQRRSQRRRARAEAKTNKCVTRADFAVCSRQFRSRVGSVRDLRARLTARRNRFFTPSAPTSSVAFVIFRSRSAAVQTSQSLFYPDSTRPTLSPAPDPSDILWRHVGSFANISSTKRAIYFIIVVGALLLLYLVPVSILNAFFAGGTWEDEENPSNETRRVFEILDKILDWVPASLRPFVAGYAPSLLLSGLMAVLPNLARFISRPMRPLTHSQLQYWAGWIIWIFLAYSIFLNTLIVNVGSEVLKLIQGEGSEALASLLSLVNPPIATALANNAQFFATYVLQRHLLGPAISALRLSDLRLVVADINIRRKQRRRRLEKARTATLTANETDLGVTTACSGVLAGEHAPSVGVGDAPITTAEGDPSWDVEREASGADQLVRQRIFSERFGSAGGTNPFDVSSAVATDAFLTGLSVVYSVYSPLLAPLVLLVFLVRVAVDRFTLYHITPPIPEPEATRDLFVVGTRWLAAGFVTGGVVSAFYFATFGTLLMGQIALGVGALTLILSWGVHARYKRSLYDHALQLPPQFDDEVARQVAAKAYWPDPPVLPGEDVSQRYDFEHPALRTDY